MEVNESGRVRAHRMSGKTILAADIICLVAVLVGSYFAVQRWASSHHVERELDRAGKVVSYKSYPEPRALPRIDFENAQGKPLTLADFRGKAVLLNIWATWCPPCRDEMPALDRLQAKLGGSNFEVVALSIDHSGIAAVRKFFDKVGITRLALYVDPSGQASSALGAVGVPMTLMIDRAGHDRWSVVGAVKWDKPGVIDVVRRAIGASSEVDENAVADVMQ